MKKKLLAAVSALMAAAQLLTLNSFAASVSTDASTETLQISAELETVELNGSSKLESAKLHWEDIVLPEGTFDSKAAENKYLTKLMYDGTNINIIENYNAARSRNSVSAAQKVIYDAVLKEAKKISSGGVTSPYFNVTTSISYSSLTSFQNDVRTAIIALIRDYPEYFYWFSSRWGVGGPYDNAGKSFAVQLGISDSYSNDNGQTFDTAKIKRAQTALNNAKAFASKCRNLPAYKKIYAFSEEIARLNVYDQDAADSYNLYGSLGLNYPDIDCTPWSLINVFDNDPSTNVVCEGYSKSMQYLCDLSGITCYLAAGSGHMWNIVVLDGVSYHVDVTFADTGLNDDIAAMKKYHPFILKGAKYSDGQSVTMYTNTPVLINTSTYTYEEDTLKLIPAKIRKVSTKDYAPVYIPKVTNFKATVGSNNVKLTWSKNIKASQYKIWYSANNGKNWTGVCTTKNNSVTTYNVKGLKANTAYTFRIKAITSSSESGYTDVKVKTAPAKVSGFKGTVSANNVRLSWSKNSAAKFYKVWYSVNNGKSWVSAAKTANNSVLSYTVKNLKANTVYKFRIRAYSESGMGDAVDIKVKTGFPKLTNVKAVSGSNNVTLSWGKNKSAQAYKIWYSTNKGKSWNTVKSIYNANVTSYNVKGLKANTTYTFRVRAYNKNKTAIANTDITAKTAPAKVANLKTTVGKTTVKLTWNKSAGATNYKVWYSMNNGKTWIGAANLKGNSNTSYTVKGLKVNTKYVFRVRPYRGNVMGTAKDIKITTKR